jgi:predicted nucleic acid-binding Zn ribbon protein
MSRSNKEKRNFVPIGQVIRDILNQSRMQTDTSLIRVWDIWEKAVGGAIATNTQPAAFKGGLLIVHATSSSWLQQLRFLKGDIILKVNQNLGQTKVKDIKFKIGPVD